MKSKRLVAICSAMCLICICLTACESSDYNAANDLFNNGQYEEAYNAFKVLGNYKDADHKVDESAFSWAKQLLESGQWEESAKIAKAIVTDDSKLNDDISILLVKCDLAKATEFFDEGKYQAAIEICQKVKKDQANSSSVVAADNLHKKCLNALEAGDAEKLLKEAKTAYEKEQWREVISLCQQICEIAAGTEFSECADKLREQAETGLTNEVAALMSELKTAYKNEEWNQVVNYSKTLIEGYSDFNAENNSAQVYLDDAKKKIQEIIAEKLQPALEKLNKEYDDVEKITWYMPDSEPRYINDYCVSFLYIGQKEGASPWLRWRTILVDNEWLYYDELIINIDGVVYTVNCSYNDIVRDSNNKNYWEYVDFQPKTSDLDLIRAIIESEKTVIRFNNEDDDKVYDFTVSQKEKDGFKAVLDAFELMQYQE